ncbi:MAG TPA: MgtC/SapB family protein [Anaeromyxobacteraceae bacterium]|nr:MgtC/SapB family protein [Anaeromyxobacteraceae bacterium]
MDVGSAWFLVHLLAALAAGAAIGMERSYHGRPAGFRTHALVSLASALLMLVTVEAGRWFPGGPETVRVDPTRMAQGIMTGIGFLGAGVIFKEGITVRGLTTAASIWITSAIGILLGVGLWAPAAAATVLTLGVLSVFRWIESKLPSYQYAYHRIRFERSNVMPEDRLRAHLRERGFSISDLSYRLTEEGRFVEYRMTIRTNDPRNFPRLAESLWRLEPVREFNISPTNG